MKRLLLFVLIAALCLPPVLAQDGCELDLLDEISSLAEAQSLAASGDSAAAAELVMSVRDGLSVELQACAQGSGLLPATFEFPDGMFRFNHPDGWAQLSPIAGVYVLGNDQDAVNITVQSNVGEEIPAGSQVLIAAYGDADELFNADDFDDFLDDMNDESFSGLTFVNPENLTINGMSGVKLGIVSELVEGGAYVFDMGGANIAFFLGITPPGEFAAFEPTFDAIVNSMNFGEGEPIGDPTPVPTIVATTTGTPLSEITYTQAVKISDYIPDAESRTAVLSPDGAHIAWYASDDDGEICVYAFAGQSDECYGIPEIFGGTPPLLLWSPDSRYIAFTQDGIIRFQEPDIWVLDVASGTFVNRTEDNVHEFSLGSKASPGDPPMLFDYTFTWGPDNMIYFVRYNVLNPSEFGSGTTAIYRIAPASGEAELVRDVTGDFERLSIYQTSQFDLNGALVVSPDASQIAFTVYEPDRTSAHNGIYLMPLSGDEAPRLVIPANELLAGTPAVFQEQGEPLFATGLAWTPDQSGLFIFAYNPAFALDLASVMYRYDFASDTLTPLTDFSAYTREELLRVPDDGKHSPIFIMARAATMSPDGTAPLMFNFEVSGGAAGLSAFIPGADGYDISTLIEFDYEAEPAYHASVASDGKALLFGWLFLPDE